MLAAALLCASGATAANGLYERALDAIATGDRAAAVALLEQLVQQQPSHAGAWLDMAMLYCSAGYATQALALFDTIETSFTPPPGILELMALQRANGCKGSSPLAAAWRGQLSRGFNSNVNQGVRNLAVTLLGAAGPLQLQLTPNYTPRSDGFAVAGLQVSVPMGTQGTRAWAQWQGHLFDTQHAFDVLAWQVGVSQPWQRLGWHGQRQVSVSQVRLGSALYQQTTSARASVGPVAALPAGWQADMSMGWSDVQYKTLAGFDARWLDVRTGARYSAPSWQLQAGVGLQADTAWGARPGGSRRGWSADALAHWALRGGGAVELGGSVQKWLDNDPYAPGLIEQVRSQHHVVVRAALQWPAGPQGQWVLEAKQVRSIENIALFGFDAASVQLGYQWRFGGREP